MAEARRQKAIEEAARVIEETARRGGDEERPGEAMRRQTERATLYDHIVRQWGASNGWGANGEWRESEETRDPIPEWGRGGRSFDEQRNRRWERESRRWQRGGGEGTMVMAGMIGGVVGMMVVYVAMSVTAPTVTLVEPKLTREETIRRIREDHMAGSENDPIGTAEEGWNLKDHDND